MAGLANNVGVTTATAGTGTVTLGAVIDATYATFAEAGVANATVVTYRISEGNDWEVGRGTYTSSGTTLSRDTVLISKIGGTAGTTKLTLAGTAEVRIAAAAEDFFGVNNLADPGADRILFWDDSAGILTWLQLDGLTISSTTIAVDAASDTAAGKIEVAVQSEMETGTSTTLAVTPGRQHYHPGHPKCWALFNGTGTPAITSSYGASSITDNGNGDWTVNWSVTFSSANWAVEASAGIASGGAALNVFIDRNNTSGAQVVRTATSVRLNANAFGTGTATDSPAVSVIGFGDL